MTRSHSTPDPSPRRVVDGAPVIDAPLRSALGRVNSLVARLLGASIATFVLTGDGRYVTASNVGMGDSFSAFPLPIGGSLCEHVISTDERFVTSESELSRSSGMDFGTSYAGIRLLDGDGTTIGAFCAIDPKGTRVWTVSDLAILADFAGLVSDHLTFDDARR